MRLVAWPRLLGINLLETLTVLPGDEEISQHGEYNQGEHYCQSLSMTAHSSHVISYFQLMDQQMISKTLLPRVSVIFNPAEHTVWSFAYRIFNPCTL